MPRAPVVCSPKELLDSLQGRLFATTTETAAILEYDGRTIVRAIKGGEIPAIRHGATWRVPVNWIRDQAGIGAGGSDAA
jgi:excisionase family DNA binding protein